VFGKDSYQPDEYPYYWRVFETNDEYFDYYRGYHAFWKLYGIDLPQRFQRGVVNGISLVENRLAGLCGLLLNVILASITLAENGGGSHRFHDSPFTARFKPGSLHFEHLRLESFILCDDEMKITVQSQFNR